MILARKNNGMECETHSRPVMDLSDTPEAKSQRFQDSEDFAPRR
ncbi:hypothetical protein HMPREF9374_1829 [Desmospora sp. 8437]|nr:hypothetical protein HMPREF9374_1829 [Desmospora sp. 8437]